MTKTLVRIIFLFLGGIPFVAFAQTQIVKDGLIVNEAGKQRQVVTARLLLHPTIDGWPNYKLVWATQFDGNEAGEKDKFWFTNPDNWLVPAVRAQSWIEFKTNPTKYKYKVRSPFTIGLVKAVEV